MQRTALLCLLCALLYLLPVTVQAQYYPTAVDAVMSVATHVPPQIVVDYNSIEVYFHKTNLNTADDGKTYEIVGLIYHRYVKSGNEHQCEEIFQLVEKSASGYRRVNEAPFIYPPRQHEVRKIAFIYPQLYPSIRYYYDYEDLYRYIHDFNKVFSQRPATVAEYNLRYGSNIPSTYKLVSGWSLRDNQLITLDRDGGGVPDWAEILMGHFPGTDISKKDDDYFCFCNPCCVCRCTCGYYNPGTCDGTISSCSCHDGSIDDPDGPDDPTEPGNERDFSPYFTVLLYFVNFLCGMYFFEFFMASMEKRWF